MHFSHVTMLWYSLFLSLSSRPLCVSLCLYLTLLINVSLRLFWNMNLLLLSLCPSLLLFYVPLVLHFCFYFPVLVSLPPLHLSFFLSLNSFPPPFLFSLSLFHTHTPCSLFFTETLHLQIDQRVFGAQQGSVGTVPWPHRRKVCKQRAMKFLFLYIAENHKFTKNHKFTEINKSDKTG